MNKKLFYFLIFFFIFFVFYSCFAQYSDGENLDEAIQSFLSFLNTIYMFVIRLTIVISILRIIWGGITYLFSVGEIVQVSEAKNMIVDAILGLTVALTSYSFLSLLGLQPP
jgi:hypothetical protein